MSYGHKLCSDQELVHDSLQEVFMDLFLKRKRLGVKIESLKAYLFVALRNSLIKKIKKSKKFESIEKNGHQEEIHFEIEYSFQDHMIKSEITDEREKYLNVVIGRLPEKQKEIVYLKFEEEMEYCEISDIMKISVESARKLLYRALVSLRKIVEPSSIPTFYFIFSKNKPI
jgi:RNA polymerase sigma-70 factor (ECF subfamily)